MGKIKPILTTLNLKEHVNGAGLLCLTLYPGDFISIGASIFVGYSKAHGDQVRIAIISPREQNIQRYAFTHSLDKLPNGDE